MNATEIVEQKTKQLKEEKIVISPEEMRNRAANSANIPQDFRGAILAANPGVIAPVPDDHSLAPKASGKRAEKMAREYEKLGANCIAIEARYRYFNELADYIQPVRRHVGVPVLWCDYIVDTYQVYEAVVLGADAVLICAPLLSEVAQSLIISCAHGCGMQTVVLVETQEEADEATKSKTNMIAVSNFDGQGGFNFGNTQMLLRHVPEEITGLSLGGVMTQAQLQQVHSYGAAGVLVEDAYFAGKGV